MRNAVYSDLEDGGSESCGHPEHCGDEEADDRERRGFVSRLRT